MEILKYIAIATIAPIMAVGGYIGSYFQDEVPTVQQAPVTVGAVIPTAIALYEDTLANSISASDTSFSLVRGTDKAGRQLATSTYAFIIDEGSATEEMVIATCTYRTCTSATRGIDPLYGTSTTASLQKIHRRGASVKITDGPQLITLSRILNGDETIPNIIKYSSSNTFTDGKSLVTKDYADGIAIAGAPDASTVTKGITLMSTAPVSPTSPIAVGDNDTRVPSQDENNALVGTSGTPSATNLFVTANDNTRNYHSIIYASSTNGTDSYTATRTPVLAAYATGTTVIFRADVANTGTASLSLDSLGAKTLKKSTSAGLANLDTGDIVIGQLVECVYNGTDWVITSVLSTSFATTYTNGVTSKSASDASTTQNIAHGLGKIPKRVRIIAQESTGSPGGIFQSTAVYNGTTQSSVSTYLTGAFGITTTTAGFTLNTAFTNGTQTGVVTFDSTNIIITWTKTNSPSGNYALLWEAEG